jgi:signal transduction histidine kinase
VKNPLAVIIGGAEFLENKLADSAEDVKANVKAIKKSALQANNILEGILQYVRPSSLNIEAVGLNDLIEEVVSLFRLQATSIKTEIVTEFNAENIRVSADKNRIHQVIFNVVKNAIEAMDGRGKVVIVTNTAEGMGVIKIIDSGVGISKKGMSKIFEPFFTTKRPGKGTGLGLVVAKTIIDNHKGRLLIESEEGKGTAVTIALPLA